MNKQTLREAFVEASSFLAEKQSGQDPKRVARWLLEFVTGMNASELLLRWDDPFPEEKRLLWQQCLMRKRSGEPVQYIIGDQEFYGRSFKVTPAVLIPRPETELLVEAALRAAAKKDSSLLRVADVGTGSGAIAVTLACLQPKLSVYAIDISADALSIARQNAKLNGVTAQIEFMQGDLLSPLLAGNIPSVDMLISNPPYIPSHEITQLHDEVKDFEPVMALDGGEDGLAIYRQMMLQLRQMDAPPAWVGLETGAGQAQQVGAWLKQLCLWNRVQIIPDLAGIDRHVIATNW